MALSESLPSAADLDAVMKERELVEITASAEMSPAESEPAESAHQQHDRSHRLAFLDLRKDSLLHFSFVLVALLIGSATLSANTLPVGVSCLPGVVKLVSYR